MNDETTFLGRILLQIINLLLPMAIRLIGLTWSLRLVNRGTWSRFIEGGEAFIGAMWHEDIIPAAWIFRGRRIMVMVSRSRDGDVSAGSTKRLGLRSVRGSSSRGGREALKTVISDAREGGQSVIVVDGPRGPAREVKVGTIIAAKRSGAPIITLGCDVDEVFRLRNWDRTRIPLPFAQIRVCLGGPLRVPGDADSRTSEEYRLRLKQVMEEADARARRR